VSQEVFAHFFKTPLADQLRVARREQENAKKRLRRQLLAEFMNEQLTKSKRGRTVENSKLARRCTGIIVDNERRRLELKQNSQKRQ
jgi:hypothetical protein